MKTETELRDLLTDLLDRYCKIEKGHFVLMTKSNLKAKIELLRFVLDEYREYNPKLKLYIGKHKI
jgi:hypothetical protein